MDDAGSIGPVLTRDGDYPEVVRFANLDSRTGSDLDFYSLAANKSSRNMEPFFIQIYPSSSRNYNLSSHEGEEFIYVLSGNVEIIYGKDSYSPCRRQYLL